MIYEKLDLIIYSKGYGKSHESKTCGSRFSVLARTKTQTYTYGNFKGLLVLQSYFHK